MEEFDVVIIGSGAGGAPIAHTLVKAEKSVLVLEKGPLFDPQYASASNVSDFKRDELFGYGTAKKIDIPGVVNNGQDYYSSHVEPDLNDEPHVYRDAQGQDKATIEGYTAQVVGGGTQLYGGVSFRFPPLDFRLGSFNKDRNNVPPDVRSEARDWPISYDDLEPYYVKTEKLVGLNGTIGDQSKIKHFSEDNYHIPPNPNKISKYAEIGMIELGKDLAYGSEPLKPYRTPLAVITRDHPPSGRKGPKKPESAQTSYVNRYGDPLGFKSSTWVSLLRPIITKPNLEVRTNCIATHLTSDGSRVNQVFYRDPAGRERLVTGKIIVVACSAIESVRLLLLSGREDNAFQSRINKSGLLGKYFLTHCFGGASGLIPGDRCDKSRALDADWATDCCATEAFLNDKGLWAGAGIYNNTSDQALPISMFRTHESTDLDSLWQGFSNNTGLKAQEIINFLDREFGRRLSVSFMANQVPQRTNRIELHPTVTDKWGRSVAYVIKGWHPHDQYLMNVLAKQCTTVLQKGGVVDDVSAGGVYMGENGLARMANHLLGGARFGTDSNDSVLDKNCRAWEFENLYVTDGSFMPTSGGGNPTHTIEANSFRVADHLLTRL